jgi:hypothetical protein
VYLACQAVRFCTATMYPINTRGEIHAQIGWGTSPVAMQSA